MIYTNRNENVFFICFRNNVFMGHHPFFTTPIALPSTISLKVCEVSPIVISLLIVSFEPFRLKGVKCTPSRPSKDGGMMEFVHRRYGQPFSFMPQSVGYSWGSAFGCIQRGNSRIGVSVNSLPKSKVSLPREVFEETNVEIMRE